MPINEKTHARRAADAAAEDQSWQSASAMDPAGESMLYDGVNMSQMVKLFEMDNRTIKAAIHGVPPSGRRRGVPIWKIRDVYSRLWRPTEEQVTEAMRRLNHDQLPKQLTKEYWAGLRSRQEYEIKAGDLWSTVKVIEEVGELLKLVRMSALLMVDTVSRQTELSDRQRAIIKESTDGMLSELHEAILKKFTPPQRRVAPDETPELAEDEHAREDEDESL